MSPLINAKTAPTTLTIVQLKIPKTMFRIKNTLLSLFLALNEKMHDGMQKAKHTKHNTEELTSAYCTTKYAASTVSAATSGHES